MIKVLRETHDTPAYVAEALCRAGGLNRFGEPNFRVVWGWNRLDWIGGKWEDRNAAGELQREVFEVRREPKYEPRDRWHVERWMAPETYGSPRAWRAQTLEWEAGRGVGALGPYPSRGEYEHVFTLERPDGGFLQVTPTIVQRLARMLSMRPRSRNEAYRALWAREARKDEMYDKRDWDLLNDTPQYAGVKVTVA